MGDGPAFRRFDKIIGKWRDLAEKRRLSFVELERTGRWKRFYTEAQFVLRMGQVSELAKIWAELAVLTPPPATAAPQTPVADAAVTDLEPQRGTT
jgi:hypothetical protein